MEEQKNNAPDVEKQEEAGKIGKAFESNMKKLSTLLKGDSLFKPTKLKASEDFSLAIEAIVKEEKEAKTKEFIDKTKALIQSKREFDKFQKEKKKEFDKQVEDKQKSFNDEANKLFGLLEDVKNLEAEYWATMTGK